MTEPLTPPECTMSGNGWFPFHFDRLRKSKWWRRASDTARARNVMMWGEAYKAVPAGSLPDDDDELAEAAGYGMDIEAFLAAKAEIMAPWVLCTDGRWYHPTVCEVVLDAWERSSERKKSAAERQRRRRDKVRGVTPQPEAVTPRAPPVTRDMAEIARDFDIQTGQNNRDASASLSLSDEKPEYPSDLEQAWKAYPHVRGRSSKPKSLGFWRRLKPDVRAALPDAAARYGREGREPKADCGAPGMHLWLKDQKFLDWLTATAPSPAIASTWSGPAEVQRAIAGSLARPEYAGSYLAACTWRDVPTRAVVTSNRAIFDRLGECRAALGRIGVELVLEQGKAA